MNDPEAYPADYRAREILALLGAARAGESAALVGLSGAGKSSLLRCLAAAHTLDSHPLAAVDANRLAAPTAAVLLREISRALGAGAEAAEGAEALAELEALLSRRLSPPAGSPSGRLTILIDRFDALGADPAVYGQLRALRDAHKYRLSYLIALRRPLDGQNELAELFFANTLWLGPLSEADARWTVTRFQARQQLTWSERTVRALIEATRGYPSFLRAACEAHAAGSALDVEALAAHPALRARLREFWADQPSDEELKLCGLAGLPLLRLGRARPPTELKFDTARLTAKENLLLEWFLAHPAEVCSKDDLIRAVWPEDRVFEQGLRDDSLAQLVRRLREKIEPDPARPRYVQTVPGRGYRFISS